MSYVHKNIWNDLYVLMYGKYVIEIRNWKTGIILLSVFPKRNNTKYINI